MIMTNQYNKFPIVCCLLIIINSGRATRGILALHTETATTASESSSALHRFFLLNAAIKGISRGFYNKTNPTLNNSILPYDDEFDDYFPSTSNNKTYEHFSWNLLSHVLAREEKNVIISPFAIRLLLVLLAEAADQKTLTQKELFLALEIETNRTYDDQRKFYKQLLPSWKVDNPYHMLNLETRLFADNTIKPNRDYLDILAMNYDTIIENLDFQKADVCVERINLWCANATKGHLNHLVTKDNLKDSVLLMASASYFSGLWRRQFNYTYQGIFFNTMNSTSSVEYMQQTDFFYYYDDVTANIKLLRLPYKGKRFAMLILLPKTLQDIGQLSNNLDGNIIKRLKSLMMETKLQVTIPKFKFHFAKDFKETLYELGLKTIFNNNASLSSLDGGVGNLKVTAVLQKAGIDVNENGTEAFASTLFEINNKFGMNPTVEQFNVDRPFIFFIEDEATSSIIFAGKVTQPYI